MKIIEFEGVLSGGYESFCWDVDKKTFHRITGRYPDEDDATCFNDDGLYRLYPGELFWDLKKANSKANKHKHRFKISYE